MQEYRAPLNNLNIDCQAIAENYLTLKKFIGPKSDCSAILKADAYSLGVAPIMRCLSKVGCNKFFVATLNEAIELREQSLTDEIYVLNGISAKEEEDFVQNNLIPVLNTKEQFERFNNYCRRKNKSFEAILHVDTGINRLGFPIEEALDLAKQDYFKQRIKLKFLMSHLACSSEPNNPYNNQQLELTKKLQKILELPVSFADSSGICLGPDYHFDLVRPGIMLYGVKTAPTPFELKPAISITSRIIQIREVTDSILVGYGNSHKMEKGGIIATIPIGYADGIKRSIETKGIFYIAGEAAPIIGRISMDLITIDVTNISKNELYIGAEVEILGPNSKVEDMAKYSGTNCHSILTSLHNRLHRNYINS